MIQTIRSGAMPWRSSHEQVSMDVLPAPTMTYWSWTGCRGSPLGGMQVDAVGDVVGGGRIDGTTMLR